MSSVQMRLAMTRAVSGLDLLAMALAMSSRPLPSVNSLALPPVSTAGNWRGTTLPGREALPRMKTTPWTALGLSSSAIA